VFAKEAQQAEYLGGFLFGERVDLQVEMIATFVEVSLTVLADESDDRHVSSRQLIDRPLVFHRSFLTTRDEPTPPESNRARADVPPGFFRKRYAEDASGPAGGDEQCLARGLRVCSFQIGSTQ
jgi:hypothetical protein